ncbi:MAG: hypothetical protein TREMPRED_004749 [Tremellales sp. Tagirdzhanova-0007]|nr:MAG: hypothetical protein TREMPRED_004749 [Tremellales sp. Tagirdzhanova-0007]
MTFPTITEMPRHKRDPDETSSEESKVTKKGKRSTARADDEAAKGDSSDGAPQIDSEILINTEGDPYIELSDIRRITVRTYRSALLVDLREIPSRQHYKDKNTGELKPGNKGISLTLDQWATVRANIGLVEEMVHRAKKDG